MNIDTVQATQPFKFCGSVFNNTGINHDKLWTEKNMWEKNRAISF